ncbi:MAG: TetR/AcrR family transcriptional regulator [Acidimicrobiia bacterium]
MPKGQPRAEQAATTRRAILTAARRLFVEQGYFGTSTEEIVAEAGVGTRGALYHHFADKRALFLAVFEEVERDLSAAGGGSRPEGDALDMLRHGLHSFLDAAAVDPAVQRIVLIDGPAVLGWVTWRGLEEHYGLGLIRQALDMGVAEGVIVVQPTEPLAHMLLAVVDEAALYIANSPHKRRARIETSRALDLFLDGLRPVRGLASC